MYPAVPWPTARGIVKGEALNEFLFSPLFFANKEKWRKEIVFEQLQKK